MNVMIRCTITASSCDHLLFMSQQNVRVGLNRQTLCLCALFKVKSVTVNKETVKREICSLHNLCVYFQGSTVWAFPLLAWRSLRGWTGAHSGYFMCQIWIHGWALLSSGPILDHYSPALFHFFYIRHSLILLDVLLCHDDELEGRRVAFILYLVPPWQSSDGGTLDLYSTDSV